MSIDEMKEQLLEHWIAHTSWFEVQVIVREAVLKDLDKISPERLSELHRATFGTN